MSCLLAYSADTPSKPEDTYPKRLGHKINISRILLCRYFLTLEAPKQFIDGAASCQSIPIPKCASAQATSLHAETCPSALTPQTWQLLISSHESLEIGASHFMSFNLSLMSTVNIFKKSLTSINFFKAHQLYALPRLCEENTILT